MAYVHCVTDCVTSVGVPDTIFLLLIFLCRFGLELDKAPGAALSFVYCVFSEYVLLGRTAVLGACYISSFYIQCYFLPIEWTARNRERLKTVTDVQNRAIPRSNALHACQKPCFADPQQCQFAGGPAKASC